MPRKKIIKSSIYPYHITNRYNNREFFPVPTEILWSIFKEELHEISIRYSVNIHAFVLMSNHYHMVLDTPLENISEAMAYFGSQVTKKANKYARRINHFFGSRYKWKLIDNHTYYEACMFYVLNNPVAANICEEITDYKFSSLNDHQTKAPWKTGNIYGKFHNLNETYKMLMNEKFSTEDLENIKKYLKIAPQK